MAEFKQNADGSVSITREGDSQEVLRVGGPKTPNPNSGATFLSDTTLAFNCNGGVDTGGGLLAWQNTLGYDIIVQGFWLDVTSASAASCSASFGKAAASTTSDSTFLATQAVNSTGTSSKTTVIATKVTQNSWITGTSASGSSAGLVARAYVTFIPVQA